MSGRRDAVTVAIDRLVVHDPHDVRDLGVRIEREIADRRFGPGRDPLVTAIATRVVAALESIREVR